MSRPRLKSSNIFSLLSRKLEVNTYSLVDFIELLGSLVELVTKKFYFPLRVWCHGFQQLLPEEQLSLTILRNALEWSQTQTQRLQTLDNGQ